MRVHIFHELCVENFNPTIPIRISKINKIFIGLNSCFKKYISAIEVPITAMPAQIEYARLTGRVLSECEKKYAPQNPKNA